MACPPALAYATDKRQPLVSMQSARVPVSVYSDAMPIAISSRLGFFRACAGGRSKASAPSAVSRCAAASLGSGSQYTSEQFQRLIAVNGATCSMSRSGNVWDNAAMVSFFFLLKTERVDLPNNRPAYRTFPRHGFISCRSSSPQTIRMS